MRISLLAPAVALLLLCIGSAQAEPKPSPDARMKVEALLRAHHGLPERSQLEAASKPHTAALLRTIAADTSTFPPVRAAAFEALKWWPDDATLALYARGISAETPVNLRHKVLRYMVVFGDRALPLLSGALGDPDRDIRLTAMNAVDDIAGARADKVLAQAAAAEKNPRVKHEMERRIARRARVR